MRRGLSIALACLWLAGCGFHLQGSQPLPPGVSTIGVSYSDPYRVGAPPVVLAIQDRLRARAALGSGDAGAQLHIHDLNQTQRILSVSPEDGRVAEYQLTVSLQFDLTRDGETLLQDQTQSVQRSYSFDDTRRLAAESQQDDLLAAMQKQLADIILLRVHNALRKPGQSTTGS